MKLIISNVSHRVSFIVVSVILLFISLIEMDFSTNSQSTRIIEIEAVKSYEQILLERLPEEIRDNAKIYLPAILKISKVHELDPLWVLSIVWTESHFKSHAKSSVGANGLMQLMPKTKEYVYSKYKKQNKNLLVEEKNFKLHHFIKEPVDQKNIHLKTLVNIEIGVIYLKRLLKRFGSQKIATIAYNMGPTWTSSMLRQNHPIGQENVYLAKVDRAFETLKPQI